MVVTSKVKEAELFAREAHGDQKYGDKPYWVHLEEVAAIAEEHIDIVPEEWREYVLMLAYLHDVIEDTWVTRTDVEKRFGVGMGAFAELISDTEGPTRRERKRLTWWKLRKHPVVTFVKICDRLANQRNSNGGPMESMYRKEFPAFEAALFMPGQFDKLWEALTLATFPRKNG